MTTLVGSLVRSFAARAIFGGFGRYRRVTSCLRTLPDFLIIGAQRCGTTSLFRYLTGHPSVIPAYRKKEVHFFDLNFGRGLAWYKSHFPLRASRYYQKTIFGKSQLTGEASPYYIFHPHALRRIAQTTPRVKLIAILRNPIDRAYSHYRHEMRLGIEKLSFPDAVARENERLDAERGKLRADEHFYSFAHQNYSYVSRGIYVEQLQSLSEAGFSLGEQVLILKTEDLSANPERQFKTLLDFLGLPDWRPAKFDIYNQLRYDAMDRETRERLALFYEPRNQKLYELIGRDFGWK